MTIQLNTPLTSHYCGHCEKIGAESRCGRCKKIYYCNKECQRQAWAAHKAACQAMANVQPQNAPSETKTSEGSTYIIERNPNKYGNGNQDYQKRAQIIVAETADAIKGAVDSGSNLIPFFHKTLQTLGSQRQRIAKDHKTDHWEYFGKRRDDEFYLPSATFMVGVYEEYQKPLFDRTNPLLIKMINSPIDLNKVALEKHEDSYEERSSTLGLSIKSLGKLENYLLKEDSYVPFFKLCGIDPKDPLRMLKLKKSSTLSQFIEENPKDHERLMLMLFLDQACRSNKKLSEYNEDIHWLIGSINSEIGGKMIPLSKYAFSFRLSKKDRNLIIDREIAFNHQDPYYIKQSLQEAAEIFKSAVHWNPKEGMEKLLNRVALFQYIFAHAMPFDRGSAAVAEWIEMSIYRYHGFDLSYNQKKMVNLEALTLPLKEFIDTYPSMIRLEKRKSIFTNQ